jgi:hypothetical protein
MLLLLLVEEATSSNEVSSILHIYSKSIEGEAP